MLASKSIDTLLKLIRVCDCQYPCAKDHDDGLILGEYFVSCYGRNRLMMDVAGSHFGAGRGAVGCYRAAAQQCISERARTEHPALQAWHPGGAADVL